MKEEVSYQPYYHTKQNTEHTHTAYRRTLWQKPLKLSKGCWNVTSRRVVVSQDFNINIWSRATLCYSLLELPKLNTRKKLGPSHYNLAWSFGLPTETWEEVMNRKPDVQWEISFPWAEIRKKNLLRDLSTFSLRALFSATALQSSGFTAWWNPQPGCSKQIFPG